MDFWDGGWLLGLSFLVKSDPVVLGLFPPGALGCFLSCSDEKYIKGFFNSLTVVGDLFDLPSNLNQLKSYNM